MAKIKTKFDSLVKLKQLKISEIEREILKLNTQISKAQEELLQLQKEISEVQFPQQGNFSLITQFKMMLDAMVNQKNEKQQQINFLNNQKEILTNRLKDANLEYEKMKYLQGEEMKKYIQKMKEKESKDMDEIALMLYKG